MLLTCHIEGFPWAELGEGATVVDVGGNTGALCLPIARACPNLKFIIQDRDVVVDLARDVSDIRPSPLLCILTLFSSGKLSIPRLYLPDESNFKVRLLEFLTEVLRFHFLLAQDFFQKQSAPQVADVYLLRMVLHDHPDAYCIDILRHLRDAAKPSTQLVIIDNIMYHTCPDPLLDEIPGAKMFDPPTPLLHNMGAANVFNNLMDLHVRISCIITYEF
jgi:hypothetical protein